MFWDVCLKQVNPNLKPTEPYFKPLLFVKIFRSGPASWELDLLLADLLKRPIMNYYIPTTSGPSRCRLLFMIGLLSGFIITIVYQDTYGVRKYSSSK